MDCEEVRKYIYAFLDDELDVERNLDVLEHLNICTDCGERFEEEKNFGQLVRNSLLRSPVPETVKSRIHQTILATSSRPAKRIGLLRSLLLVGLVGLAAAALAWLFGVLCSSLAARPESSLMKASLDRHRKYLRDELPMEIVSQDADAVSVYFRTKFGFAIAVRSLASEDFHLVGGRLCHLVGSPAACIVYHRPGGAKVPPCTLSLYILADKPSLALGETARIEGGLAVYSAESTPVVAWRRMGILSALVSDGALEELLHLARALQAPSTTGPGRWDDSSRMGVAKK